MTRQKSDSQLDAEAAAPQRSLDAMLADHRALYQADLFIPRLSTESPPVFTDSHTGVQSADPMSMIGPTLSKQLAGYIDYHQRDGETVPTPSGIFPYARSMATMRRECRRAHSDHWDRPEWRGSLCNRLVSMTVAEGYAFDRACYDLVVDRKRSERVLRRALVRIVEHMDELQARQTYAKTDGVWPAPPPHVHRPLGGLHQIECEQCRRAA